ncbi:hypothetical protein [Protaetiibacter intestinalis]|uniref:Uncharacterized protein n=1 Tax=Protaetiibacter intestinalis TaxID=2419774 RepID=A0A387BA32_9MICO|nr:hypothetical protein [Protaetiibacter intestinalis]AYF97799.1 hypothetical protein D7I47_05695 [Protaetiibacter intestinalis]
MIDTDPIEELLARSAPRTTTATPELREELTRMAVASGNERRASRSRRRIAVGTGIATVALLAGAGTAAATGVIEWGPWAQDPDVVYAYSLPSGDACELRIAFDDDATGATARDIAAGIDFASAVDVEAEIARIRATSSTAGDEFGNSWDTSYGTDDYLYADPDFEYDTAVQQGVTGVLFEELNARGVDPAAQDATVASTCSIERANEG